MTTPLEIITMNDVRKWKVDQAKSWRHLIYGVPIGIVLILAVYLASLWLPIPFWLVILIAAIEVVIFALDGITVIVLSSRIRGAIKQEPNNSDIK